MFTLCQHIQNDHYEPFQREEVLVDPRPSHLCADKKPVVIQVIDEHGMVGVYLCVAWFCLTSFEI